MNFDFISVMIGVVFGGAVGYFINYSKAHTLQETLDIVRKSAGTILVALEKERNLSEGLQQELAVQAKVLPATK